MWNLLAGLITTYLGNRAEKAQAKHEREIKQITGEQEWDISQSNNAGSSWKDEWFTIVLSVPMIGAFIPTVVPYIEEGFRVLDSMPDYYKGFLGAAVAASFGIKALSNWGNK